jgi:hypothetical protein
LQLPALHAAKGGGWFGCRMTKHAAIPSLPTDYASNLGLLSACVLHRLIIDRLFRRWQHPAVGLEEGENVFVMIGQVTATNVLV